MKKLILFHSLMLLALLLTTEKSFAGTADDSNQVHMVYQNDNWDIQYQNLLTGDTQMLTSDGINQAFPDIFEQTVVYQQEVVNESNEVTGYDIYVTEIDTMTKTKISNTEGYNTYPKIYQNYVIWHHMGQIVLYDRTTRQERIVTSENAYAFGADMDGGTLVWMDVRSGDFDIYLRDISSSGEEINITQHEGKQADPKISNGTVIWHDYRSEDREIYSFANNQTQHVAEGNILSFVDGYLLYNGVAGNKVREIASGNEFQAPANVNELIVVNGEVKLLDSASQTIFPMTKGERHYSSATADTSETREPGEAAYTFVSNDQHVALSFKSRESVQATINSKQMEEKMIDYEVVDGRVYEINFDKPVASELSIRFTHAHADHDPLLYHIFGFDEKKKEWIQMPTRRDKEGWAVTTSGAKTFLLARYRAEFKDMSAHWAHNEVQALSSQGIVTGFPTNLFKPDEYITRAEYIALLLRTFGPEHTGTSSHSFSDIDGHWAKKDIDYAKQLGVAKGYGSQFRPDDSLTRQEMVSMLIRMLNRYGSTNQAPTLDKNINQYRDYRHIHKWAVDDFQQALTLGIVEGSGSSLLPQSKATRAEASVILYRILSKNFVKGGAE